MAGMAEAMEAAVAAVATDRKAPNQSILIPLAYTPLPMPSKRDSPSELAKQTLTLLAKERRVPLPENYCEAYRAVDGNQEKWSAYCRYTKLLEDALLELVGSWQVPSPLLGPETALLAREIGQFVATASSEGDLKRVRDVAHDLGGRIKRDLTSGSNLQVELTGLMRFVFANLGTFAEEDQWLRNQLQATGESLVSNVSAESVSSAKDVLGSIVVRQQELQKVIATAQHGLKAIMLEIVRQASSLVEDTAGYSDRMLELGEHIRSSNDLAAIKSVVDELDAFVKDMGNSVRRSHDYISSTHTRLVQAEQQIVDLRRDLAQTSEKVRRDNLTGALNRSGLEEIWLRETVVARTNATPLSIGILDIDNFKLINDQYGHVVGDEALVHLTSVIRNALHGTDTMARYGGEEFVILLPDTDADGARALMLRLQRELTRHFFMRGESHVLVTFSAGVTAVHLERDTLVSAVERADSALYEAKHTGKNRVCVA
jgi:diguanylate cyclase